MGQGPQKTTEGSTDMKRTGRILLVLSCALFEILGCRKEDDS